MITIQFSPKVGRTLLKLIDVAERKGRKSQWWQELVAPLVTIQPSAKLPPYHKGVPESLSFREQLGRAVGP